MAKYVVSIVDEEMPDFYRGKMLETSDPLMLPAVGERLYFCQRLLIVVRREFHLSEGYSPRDEAALSMRHPPKLASDASSSVRLFCRSAPPEE